MEKDERMHHFVPVVYLRSWAKQIRAGKWSLTVDRKLKSGVIRTACNPVTEVGFKKKGYYDLTDYAQFFPESPTMLEDITFAKHFEPKFGSIMRETLAAGIQPTQWQAQFLAMFAISLCTRSPAHEAIRNLHFQTIEPNRPILQHVGVVVQTLVIQSATVLHNCRIEFLEAPAEIFFSTCDVPCWLWDSIRSVPYKGIHTHFANGYRYLCPLSPRWAVAIYPLGFGGQSIYWKQLSVGDVELINEMVVSQAMMLTVLP